ncbi:(-)-germacrene D synthase-like [Iris pallida]|uniref:(-)-germacrene D synthase-like n=1 Tax=Iris pallida TaxID=29817 RepID=A0AAX6FBU9_IRIPA|nr:(-)-germacrene D synthase-like [Iris pallida]
MPSPQASVFNKFKDSEGKFKQELSYDVEGLLQLYEASMLDTNNELILKEARDFARGHMDRMKGEEPHTAQIGRALETPFHHGMRRLEARLYIPVYAKSKACIAILLELAKLDFNHLQSIHQAEIQSFYLWSEEFGLMKHLPFYRDRVAESYFWILGVWFEPRYSTERLLISKLFNLMTVIDDIYDAYGTIEELQLFTNQIQRWDFQNVDGLPEYMQIFLNAFTSFMTEIEEELKKKGTLHHRHYIIELSKLPGCCMDKHRIQTNIRRISQCFTCDHWIPVAHFRLTMHYGKRFEQRYFRLVAICA